MSADWGIATAFRPSWGQGQETESAPLGFTGLRDRWPYAILLLTTTLWLAAHFVVPPLNSSGKLVQYWAAIAFYLRTFQFHFGCVALLWAVWLGWRRRLTLALFAGGVAMLGIQSELRSLWPSVAMPIEQTNRVRVMSVNQLRGNFDTQRTQLAICEEKPDIVALQEYSVVHDQQLSAALKADYPYSARFPFPESNGLAIFSKRPLAVERVPSMEFGSARLMGVRLTIDGRDMVLFNIHPTSPGPPHRIIANRRQVAQLLTAIHDEARPVVIVGDCNFPLNSQQMDVLRDAGMRPADDFGGSGVRWSWSPLRDGPRVTRIDHVLISCHFVVKSNRIGPPIGSDHRPVIVDLAWVPGGS